MAISKFTKASITTNSSSIVPVPELEQLMVTSCFNFAIRKSITEYSGPALPFENSFDHWLGQYLFIK